MRGKKLTGYKLIKTEYEQAALILSNTGGVVLRPWKKTEGIDIEEGSDFCKNLKESGVLDLWFHKIEVKV